MSALVIRRVMQVRPAMQTVPPQFRSPVFYLVHQSFTGKPPKRRPGLDRALGALIPRSLASR